MLLSHVSSSCRLGRCYNTRLLSTPARVASKARPPRRSTRLPKPADVSGDGSVELLAEICKKRGRGRPRKNAVTDMGMRKNAVTDMGIPDTLAATRSSTLAATRPSTASSQEKPRKKAATAVAVKPAPSRVSLLPRTPKHSDLASFLKYAQDHQLNTKTHVYRGTHFEYTVAEALKKYCFQLYRIGRRNDLGIDLIGEWALPRRPSNLRVIIQCKLSAPAPRLVRELEGAYVGAPSGWRGSGVMALLITSKPTTKGVRDALQRSRLPMGFLQVTPEGIVQQFLWNRVAEEGGLAGMSATNVYLRQPIDASNMAVSNATQAAIMLTWLGKSWTGSVWQ